MPTPVDTLLLGIFSAGGIALAALGYRQARRDLQLQYRLYYLRRKADRRFRAGDWDGARRLYEAALAGDDGLDSTPENRRLRLTAEYSLAHVNVRDAQYAAAAKQLDAIETRYTTAADAGMRAHVVYLRSFVADGLGDAATARRLRRTAMSHFKERGKSPELTNLLQYEVYDRQRDAWEATNGQLDRLRGLLRERRPSLALREAQESLRSPALVGLARSYIEGIAGHAERTFGNFDEADRHFVNERLESGGAGYLPHQASLVMRRASNAAFNADRDAAAHFRGIAVEMAKTEDALSRGYALAERFLVDYYVSDLTAAQDTLNELESLYSTATHPITTKTLQRLLTLNRLCLLTHRSATEAQIAEAARHIDAFRKEDDSESYDSLYLDAYALKVLALQGQNNDEFLSGVAALEEHIGRFLAEREPADAAALRVEYAVLIMASLTASAFDTAARFLDRFTALPAYPIYAPDIALWRGRICLARGDRAAARQAFSAALASGLETDAAQEARERLKTLNEDEDSSETSA